MATKMKMYFKSIWIVFFMVACNVPGLVQKPGNLPVPSVFETSADSGNSASLNWKVFFKDPYLVGLIDTALSNNQELNIVLQEMEIARNEVRARKGEYLPFVNFGTGMGLEKTPRYTSKGSSEATTQIKPGKATPDPIPDFKVGVYATWELDIWRKLRNSRKSAFFRYLATVDGKNFLVTRLISEIAHSYFELLALQNQLDLVKQNISLQNNALMTVKMEKEATRVTELAVRRFEAQVLHTRSLQFDIQQRMVETENRIHFLVGRYPKPMARSNQDFYALLPEVLKTGVPSQLLENRPDIQAAEKQLAASKLDVQVAKANFYPRLGISAGLGLQAFSPVFLLKAPESILYALGGELLGPLVNRNGIKALYFNANARQIQAVYNYQRTLLMAYIEVSNQLSNISNLQKSYSLKSEQVDALNQSVTISNNLFRSARADYMEVLLTQRDALESKFDLIETKKQQMSAMVNMYQALGGGWK